MLRKSGGLFLALAFVALSTSGCRLLHERSTGSTEKSHSASAVARAKAPSEATRPKASPPLAQRSPTLPRNDAANSVVNRNDPPAAKAPPRLDQRVAPTSREVPSEEIAHVEQAALSEAPSADPADPVSDENAREAPKTPSPTTDPLERMNQILRRAEEFNAKHPDFVCRMTRSERILGSIRQPELMLMKLRGAPRSVHLKWLDPANEGRECLWVAGRNDNKMVSRGGKGDLLLAGRTLRLDPHSSLAKSKSSQTIDETGLDITCARIRGRIDALRKGDVSLGTMSPSTGSDPFIPDLIYDWIVHQSPPGVDSDLPQGGIHRYGFRLDDGRLEVVHAFNARQQLVYTYRFERWIPVAEWKDSDFDEDLLWARSKEPREPTTEEKMVLREEEQAR